MGVANLQPYVFYSLPDKTPDGEGGWTYGEAVPKIVYAKGIMHQAVLSLIVRAETHLRVYDVFNFCGEWYRVISFVSTGSAQYQNVSVEKIEMPIYICHDDVVDNFYFFDDSGLDAYYFDDAEADKRDIESI